MTFGRSLFEEMTNRREVTMRTTLRALFATTQPSRCPKRLERLALQSPGTHHQLVLASKLQDRHETESHHLDRSPDPHRRRWRGMQQLLESAIFHGRPPPGNLFALRQKPGPMGIVATSDSALMDSTTMRSPFTLTAAVVHLIQPGFPCPGRRIFRPSAFLRRNADLPRIVRPLETVARGQLGETSRFVSTSRRSRVVLPKMMFD